MVASFDAIAYHRDKLKTLQWALMMEEAHIRAGVWNPNIAAGYQELLDQLSEDELNAWNQRPDTEVAE